MSSRISATGDLRMMLPPIVREAPLGMSAAAVARSTSFDFTGNVLSDQKKVPHCTNLHTVPHREQLRPRSGASARGERPRLSGLRQDGGGPLHCCAGYRTIT